MRIKCKGIGHRSHQNGVRRWCRVDRKEYLEIQKIAEVLNIPYKED